MIVIRPSRCPAGQPWWRKTGRWRLAATASAVKRADDLATKNRRSPGRSRGRRDRSPPALSGTKTRSGTMRTPSGTNPPGRCRGPGTRATPSSPRSVMTLRALNSCADRPLALRRLIATIRSAPKSACGRAAPRRPCAVARWWRRACRASPAGCVSRCEHVGGCQQAGTRPPAGILGRRRAAPVGERDPRAYRPARRWLEPVLLDAARSGSWRGRISQVSSEAKKLPMMSCQVWWCGRRCRPARRCRRTRGRSVAGVDAPRRRAEPQVRAADAGGGQADDRVGRPRSSGPAGFDADVVGAQQLFLVLDGSSARMPLPGVAWPRRGGRAGSGATWKPWTPARTWARRNSW